MRMTKPKFVDKSVYSDKTGVRWYECIQADHWHQQEFDQDLSLISLHIKSANLI